jgi:hypothetical protein
LGGDLVNRKRKSRFVAVEGSKESKGLETEDIYDDDQREEMLLDDEITAAEDGFMQGRELSRKKVKHLKRSEHKDSISVELAEEDYTDD